MPIFSSIFTAAKKFIEVAEDKNEISFYLYQLSHGNGVL